MWHRDHHHALGRFQVWPGRLHCFYANFLRHHDFFTGKNRKIIRRNRRQRFENVFCGIQEVFDKLKSFLGCEDASISMRIMMHIITDGDK